MNEIAMALCLSSILFLPFLKNAFLEVSSTLWKGHFITQDFLRNSHTQKETESKHGPIYISFYIGFVLLFFMFIATCDLITIIPRERYISFVLVTFLVYNLIGIQKGTCNLKNRFLIEFSQLVTYGSCSRPLVLIRAHFSSHLLHNHFVTRVFPELH